MRGFVSLCSYYRAFCPGFSAIAEPLNECLRKGFTREWTERRQEAFDKLKSLLVSPPVLATPIDDGLYVLDVDSSMLGAGAVLQQYQNGALRVIEYASRTFNSAERRYCATRLEMAGLVFGLRHFRQYLLGRKFVVRCDHMALVYDSKTKEPVGQQARFLDFIAEFDFDLQYREGNRHVNADSLSRRRPCELDDGQPCKQCNRRVTGRHVKDTAQVRRVQTRASNNARPESCATGKPTNVRARPDSQVTGGLQGHNARPESHATGQPTNERARPESQGTGMLLKSRTRPEAEPHDSADGPCSRVQTRARSQVRPDNVLTGKPKGRSKGATG